MGFFLAQHPVEKAVAYFRRAVMHLAVHIRPWAGACHNARGNWLGVKF